MLGWVSPRCWRRHHQYRSPGTGAVFAVIALRPQAECEKSTVTRRKFGSSPANKKVLKSKEIKSNFSFHSHGKTFCTGKIQEAPCREMCETQRVYFQHKSWSFDCIRNGNKRSSFGEKHGNFQLELPAEAQAALRGSTLPGAQGAGDFSGSKLKGTRHGGGSRCHRQSSLLFVQHQGFGLCSSNCSRDSDPESRAEHTQTPEYRGKSSGEEKRMEEQVLSRGSGDFQLSTCFISTCCTALPPECPWKQKEMSQVTWFHEPRPCFR